MSKKLTLNVDENVIEKAKIYAQKTGRSLSGLVENYLKNLVDHHHPEITLEDKITRLSGKIQLPADFDEDKILKEYFEEKHLK
ncbi:MAG: hypothetical protein EA341_03755 [Mongoliibacter sp.]|uniref:DUF6364 family protein n=1 Tax=Mongoliibacter sp. TaxID=2022438 RepID=UPI0012EF6D57|nr:DUF6364 family protein [Mongoliibacter sp.]TVP52102.1 MAG: hypothetical protein EA341_03755 [Mongoliibacter sp.]